jgi:hypothetical protein
MLETFKLKDKNEQEQNCEQCQPKTQTSLSNTTLNQSNLDTLVT